MKMRTGSLLVAAVLATAGMSALVTGCELIASVDRSTIEGTGGGGGGGTGGTTATSSSASTTGAGGGTTSSSSTGGATCVDAAKDCPAPANECVTAICASGACAVMNVADGGPVTMQTPGDCKKDVCDGAGKTKSINDDDDINDDAKECTVDTCAEGAVVHTPKAPKTACGMAGGTLKCDATGACVGCVDASDCGAAPACKVNTCTAGVCGTANVADATTCSDGNGCTQTDTCMAGVCTGSNPVVCTALSQCHNPGTCVPATGVCSTSLPKGNSAGCNDANMCTQTDACLAGVCTGSDPVMCPAPDQCHNAATCVAATGLCPLNPKTNGTPCIDSNACTTMDTCQAGTCAGTPVVCTALDECHDAGTCALATGVCSNPNKADGTLCGMGMKTCQAGVCL